MKSKILGLLVVVGLLASLGAVAHQRFIIGTDVQAYDADLADLADGTLTGSKVSGAVVVAAGTVNSSVIGGSTPAAATFTTAAITEGAIISGTYTPTLTNVANVAASTAYSCQYIRVGNVVTVSGRVDIDPTAQDTSTDLGLTLPIASDLANANECAGVGGADANASNRINSIQGDTTNNRANFHSYPATTANQQFYFTFTYRIL